MGSAQSQKLTEQITEINEAMMDVVNTHQLNATQNCSTDQNISVVVAPGGVIKGPLVTNATAELSCNLTGTSKSSFSTDLNTAMQAALDNVVSQATSDEQGFLSTSMNVQNTSMSVNEYIRNTIETTVTNLDETNCDQNLNMKQQTSVLIQGTVESADLSERIQAAAVADCVGTAVFDNLMSNSQYAALYNDLDQTMSNKALGLESLTWGFIAIAVIAALGALAYFYMKSSGARSKEKTKAIKAQSKAAERQAKAAEKQAKVQAAS